MIQTSAYWTQYLLVGMLMLAAIGMAAMPILLSRFIHPHQPGKVKSDPYECGVAPDGDPWIRFRISFYRYALIFVLFEVEVALLFPWAADYKNLLAGTGSFAFLEMAVFLFVLGAGLAWVWAKKDLEWDRE